MVDNVANWFLGNSSVFGFQNKTSEDLVVEN